MLLLSWSLQQRFDSSPSHPLPTLSPTEPPVNTEALNAAQAVREKLQHAFHTLHSPTAQPAQAQNKLQPRGEI